MSTSADPNTTTTTTAAVPSESTAPPRPSTPPPEKRVISAVSTDDQTSPTAESSAAKKVKMDQQAQEQAQQQQQQAQQPAADQQQPTAADPNMPSMLPSLSGLLNHPADQQLPGMTAGMGASNPYDLPGMSMGAIPLMGTGATSGIPGLDPNATLSALPASMGGALPQLLIKKLNDKAKPPTRGSAQAAGYDLYASEGCVIPKGGKFLVETGLSMAVPEGCYGRVAPRSGLASKNFIDVGAGVIDSDYRGPVKILLFNHSDVDFEVHEGDRVAQLILERIYNPEVIVVENLEESVRGAGGFGSSGR